MTAERSRPRVGWCEWVALPSLGVRRLKAKVDTGARSCALHVVAMTSVGGELELEIPSGRRTVRVRCPAVGRVKVRDSGGHVDERPVIEAELRLGATVRRVRITLTDRGDMRFPMLIGRTALGGYLVDPTARFLLGKG